MFNKKDYQAAFDQVRASEDTYQEVMHMTSRRKNQKTAGGRRVVVLIAAVVALMAMTVTAFAAEEIAGWFQTYFSRNSDAELSQQQVEYLAENEQVIAESKTIDGWTVELRSAIHDDTTGYIILGVTAPMDMDAKYDENGDRVADFAFGNASTVGYLSDAPDLVTASDGVAFGGWSWKWVEDGDGLANTKNLLISLNPWMESSDVEPFGSEAQYSIYIENIIWEYEDEEYRQELLNGKYAGQTDVMFTDEETKRIYCAEVLVEGIWEFTVDFAEPSDSAERKVEVLDTPVTTKAWFLRQVGPEISDYVYVEETVSLTSIVMQNLTVTFYCDDCDGIPELTWYEEEPIRNPLVVLKDGTQIELWSYGSNGTSYVTLVAEQPIVFEEVDHILMADGTMIPMPELEAE